MKIGYYYEYSKVTRMYVIHYVDEDGDRVIDVLTECEFEIYMEDNRNVVPKDEFFNKEVVRDGR